MDLQREFIFILYFIIENHASFRLDNAILRYRKDVRITAHSDNFIKHRKQAICIILVQISKLNRIRSTRFIFGNADYIGRSKVRFFIDILNAYLECKIIAKQDIIGSRLGIANFNLDVVGFLRRIVLFQLVPGFVIKRIDAILHGNNASRLIDIEQILCSTAYNTESENIAFVINSADSSSYCFCSIFRNGKVCFLRIDKVRSTIIRIDKLNQETAIESITRNSRTIQVDNSEQHEFIIFYSLIIDNFYKSRQSINSRFTIAFLDHKRSRLTFCTERHKVNVAFVSRVLT